MLILFTLLSAGIVVLLPDFEFGGVELNRHINWVSLDSLVHCHYHANLLLGRVRDAVLQEDDFDFVEIRKFFNGDISIRVSLGLQVHVAVVVVVAEVECNLCHQHSFEVVCTVLLLGLECRRHVVLLWKPQGRLFVSLLFGRHA